MPYAKPGNWFYFQFGNKEEQGANLSNEDGNIFPTDCLCCTVSKWMVHREAAQDIILLSQKTLLCIFIKYILRFDSSLSLPLSLSVSLCVSGSLCLCQQFKWKVFLEWNFSCLCMLSSLALLMSRYGLTDAHANEHLTLPSSPGKENCCVL